MVRNCAPENLEVPGSMRSLSSGARSRDPLASPRNDAIGAHMRTELDKVVAALKEFYDREAFILAHDLGERTLTHRLAVCMERQFSGFEVDCNYDRLGARTLRLPHGTIVSTDDHLGKSIYPDIVVHQREIPNNLLAIEVRKANNHQAMEHDR